MKFEEGRIIKRLKVNGKEAAFRLPKESDAKQLMNFINSLVGEKASIMLMEKVTQEKEKLYLENMIAGMKNGSKIQLITEVDGKIVGNAHIEKKMRERHSREHVAEIGIGVLKGYREKGLGQAMMEMLIQMARKEWKTEIVYLTVYVDNGPALGLYKKLGFRKVGRIPRGIKFYNKYIDEVIMIKELK